MQSETVSSPAPVVVRPDEGTSVRWGPAGVIRIVAGADSTNGSFRLVQATEEAGRASPLHVHHGEAEALYVLDGAIQVTCGDDTVTAQAGDFVHARGVPHEHSVLGERPARVLLLFSRPGFESFFAEGGAPLDQPPAGRLTRRRCGRLVDKYDMEPA
jgi:quercetin dioxygenase-like cupin family protein